MERDSNLRFSMAIWGVLISYCMLLSTEAIWLNLPSSGTKCVSKEIQNNVVVLPDYSIIKEDGQSTITVSTKVDGHERASLNLDWKIGVNTKDWDSVEKKEKIEGDELEVKKLEGAVEAILENLST